MAGLTHHPRHEPSPSHLSGVRPSLPSASYVPRTMPAVLGTGDLTSLFLLNVFWVTNVTPLVAGGSASFTYWLLGGLLFFVPCSLVVAQLAACFPHEGSIYAWTHYALGRRWAFFVGVCAWLPGVLSMVNAAAAFISCLQALNAHWLIPSWQQGLAIVAVLGVTAFLSTHRTRVVQLLCNAAVLGMLFSTVLVGGAALFWLIRGHPSATNLTDMAGWRILAGPQGNLALLGSVVLALMGSDMPLALAGEVRHRKALRRHLMWGTLLTLVGYLLFTWALLVVQGAGVAAQTVNPMSLLLATVTTVFGKAGGEVTAVCLLWYFLLIPVALNVCFARLVLVAAIDGRISVRFARLNVERVPVRALVTQIVIATVFAAILYLLVPQIGLFGDPASFTSEAYNVLGASLLLVWAISFLFPFLDVAVLALRHPRWFARWRVVPGPLLVFSVVTGCALCLATIIITLFNSFIPTLLPNGTWWWLVGGMTIIWLVCSLLGTMLTTAQAGWEQLTELTTSETTSTHQEDM